MQNIRALFLTVTAITAFIAMAFLTFSLTLAFAGILTVLMAARAISLKMKPVPVRAKANTQREMRVWNDGRGTIIDL